MPTARSLGTSMCQLELLPSRRAPHNLDHLFDNRRYGWLARRGRERRHGRGRVRVRWRRMLHKGGDLVSELGLAAGPELLRIVGQDGQRRLQSVGQIRGVRPGPLDRRILRVQQAVDLGGKRLNLVGKVCPEPRRGAGADRCEPAADRIERPQADPHLHPGGGDENAAAERRAKARARGRRRDRRHGFRCGRWRQRPGPSRRRDSAAGRRAAPE